MIVGGGVRSYITCVQPVYPHFTHLYVMVGGGVPTYNSPVYVMAGGGVPTILHDLRTAGVHSYHSPVYVMAGGGVYSYHSPV